MYVKTHHHHQASDHEHKINTIHGWLVIVGRLKIRLELLDTAWLEWCREGFLKREAAVTASRRCSKVAQRVCRDDTKKSLDRGQR